MRGSLFSSKHPSIRDRSQRLAAVPDFLNTPLAPWLTPPLRTTAKHLPCCKMLQDGRLPDGAELPPQRHLLRQTESAEAAVALIPVFPPPEERTPQGALSFLSICPPTVDFPPSIPAGSFPPPPQAAGGSSVCSLGKGHLREESEKEHASPNHLLIHQKFCKSY